MTTKIYIGEYKMPYEIKVAAHAFYEALRRCGFDSGSVDVCVPLGDYSVRLTQFYGGGKIKTTNTELHDGKWQIVDWIDDD